MKRTAVGLSVAPVVGRERRAGLARARSRGSWAAGRPPPASGWPRVMARRRGRAHVAQRRSTNRQRRTSTASSGRPTARPVTSEHDSRSSDQQHEPSATHRERQPRVPREQVEQPARHARRLHRVGGLVDGRQRRRHAFGGAALTSPALTRASRFCGVAVASNGSGAHQARRRPHDAAHRRRGQHRRNEARGLPVGDRGAGEQHAARDRGAASASARSGIGGGERREMAVVPAAARLRSRAGGGGCVRSRRARRRSAARRRPCSPRAFAWTTSVPNAGRQRGSRGSRLRLVHPVRVVGRSACRRASSAAAASARASGRRAAA